MTPSWQSSWAVRRVGVSGIDVAAPSSRPELMHYTGFVRRHWLVLVIGLVLGSVLGVTYQHTQPKTYRSVASLTLEPLPTYVARDPLAESAEYVTVDTDGQLAKSTRVLRPVARTVGESVGAVRQNLLVTASPLSSVLHLALSATTPRQAQAGAQQAARSLLRARGRFVRSSVSIQAKQLTESIDVLERQLLTASKSFDTERTDGLNSQIITLRRRLRELQLVKRSVGHIIAAAELPTRGAGASFKVTAASGAMLGLLGGLVVARVRDVRSRRSRSPAQLGTTGRAASAAG